MHALPAFSADRLASAKCDWISSWTVSATSKVSGVTISTSNVPIASSRLAPGMLWQVRAPTRV